MNEELRKRLTWGNKDRVPYKLKTRAEIGDAVLAVIEETDSEALLDEIEEGGLGDKEVKERVLSVLKSDTDIN